MFKALLILLSSLLVLGLGLIVFPIKERDRIQYAELCKSSNPETNEALLSYSEQKRKGVRKQVWYQDEDPLYFRIEGQESELFFFRQNNRVEIVEELTDVTCIMQEDLFYEGEKPMQRVRYLKAERASYNYSSHLFVAENVHLWKYQLEGHTPPDNIEHAKALMRATAQSVEFTLKGNKLNFIAHQMKATVNGKEKIL